jgi:flagellar capping protein FliD
MITAKHISNNLKGTIMKPDTDPASLATRIREAVAQGTHVQEAVRHLTLEALSAHHLNLDSIRSIMQAVVQGAHEAIAPQLEHTTNTALAAQVRLKEAVAGLDTALAQFAEASRLALEEAAGRARHFSDKDLARTRADLAALEEIFVETLQNSSKTTKGFIADTLRELGEHAKRTSTAVGEQVKTTLATLSQQMGAATHAQLESGIELARATSDMVRQIAAGMLSGLADRIKPDDKKSS